MEKKIGVAQNQKVSSTARACEVSRRNTCKAATIQLTPVVNNARKTRYTGSSAIASESLAATTATIASRISTPIMCCSRLEKKIESGSTSDGNNVLVTRFELSTTDVAERCTES